MLVVLTIYHYGELRDMHEVYNRGGYVWSKREVTKLGFQPKT